MFIVLTCETARDDGELSLWKNWFKDTNQSEKLRLCDKQASDYVYQAFYYDVLSQAEKVGNFPKKFFDVVKEDYKIEDFL